LEIFPPLILAPGVVRSSPFRNNEVRSWAGDRQALFDDEVGGSPPWDTVTCNGAEVRAGKALPPGGAGILNRVSLPSTEPVNELPPAWEGLVILDNTPDGSGVGVLYSAADDCNDGDIGD